MVSKIKTKVVVLGSGPSGYSAAFRCADLGLDTVLIERYPELGGVCLNVGCIPSKALLHIAKVFKEVQFLKQCGISFKNHKINFEKVHFWKTQLIKKLTSGLTWMAKERNVNVIHGTGKFVTSNSILVENEKEDIEVDFDNAIIAVGSRPIKFSSIDSSNVDNSRIWNSTDALELKKIPKNMLIVGGGVIGLEMGTVYHSFGSKIDILEMSDQLIPGADKDISDFFVKQISQNFNLMFESKLNDINVRNQSVCVTIENKGGIVEKTYDVILVAIGRVPNGKLIGAHSIGIEIDSKGFIKTNNQMQTNLSHIYAIGDVVGHPMLAHKGIHEGHISAEVISGLNHYYDPKAIPIISYTDPEVAWSGLTEHEARTIGINCKAAYFPWSASGRAATSNSENGITKLIVNTENNRIIGGAVVGVNGGELLGEITLAIEMGCDVEDISLTIHPHPTLNETICMASKVFQGSVTDILNYKR